MNGYVPLDQRYLEWLYSLVEDSSRRPHAQYWQLFEQLYNTPFVWFVPNDDNRIEDAREIRNEYANIDIHGVEDYWMAMDISVLELIMAMSRRVSFQFNESPGPWFWVLLDNLGLLEFDDRYWSSRSRRAVIQIVYIFMHRTYEPNGHGGLFPLQHAVEDQRGLELWDQMSQYTLERF